MGTLVTSKPVVSTVVDATVLANNFTAIENVINGGIDNSNINASAAIAISKLAGYPSDATKYARGDGTWAVPAANVTYRKTTSKTVNTTVAATDLLNAEITIGAGVLGTTGTAEFSAWGDFLQNSGGATNAFRFQLLLGATPLFDTGAPGAGTLIGNSATRGRWKVTATIQNANAANAQTADFELQFTPGSATQLAANVAAAFTTGQGIYHNQGRSDGVIPELHGAAYNASTEDTASSKALLLKVINPSASGSCETVLKGALVKVF